MNLNMEGMFQTSKRFLTYHYILFPYKEKEKTYFIHICNYLIKIMINVIKQRLIILIRYFSKFLLSYFYFICRRLLVQPTILKLLITMTTIAVIIIIVMKTIMLKRSHIWNFHEYVQRSAQQTVTINSRLRKINCASVSRIANSRAPPD